MFWLRLQNVEEMQDGLRFDNKQGFAKGGEILSPPAEFKLLREKSEFSA